MLLARAWRESGLVRLARFLRSAAAQSAVRRLCFGTAEYARQDAVRESAFGRAAAALARLAVYPLERVGGAVGRALPGSALLGGTARVLARRGVLSGSALAGAVAGIRAESCLWLVLSYPLVDYAVRRTPGLAAAAPWWDEALLLLTAAAWVLQMAVRGRVTWRLTPLDVPILLYAAVAVFLVLVRSPAMNVALEGVRVYFEYMLWFFAGSNLLLNRRQARAVFTWLVLLGTVLGVHGVYQYAVGAPIPEAWLDTAEATVRTRVYSIVGSPNVLGSLFVLLIPLAATGFLAARTRPARYFYLACLAPMGLALIFTFSRGAWMAMAAAVLAYGLLYNWQALLALGLLVYAVPRLVPGVASRIGYLFSPAYLMSSARAGRVARWNKALEVWHNFPLTGVGFGRYGGAVAARHVPGSEYVDNFYLKTLAETGVVGLGALLLLILAGLRCALNAFSRLEDRVMRGYAAGVIAGLCGVLVHNLVENVFEVPMMATYFWLLLGMVAALPHLEDGGLQAGGGGGAPAPRRP